MIQETCITLSAVFPLILVTTAIEHRRAIKLVRRRERVFKTIVEYSMMGSLIGLVMTVIGVQMNGLEQVGTFFVWLFFGFGVFGLGVMLIAIVEQDRDDHAVEVRREQEAQAQEAERQRLALEAQRRSRSWLRRLVRYSNVDRSL
jgi:heme exporter protein D